MSSTWKAALGIVLIFALGCFSGALSSSIYYRNQMLTLQASPAEVTKILENRFTRRLQLDPDQQKQIHDILAAYVQNRRALVQRLQPDVQVLNRQMMMQIGSVLRPDQMAEFRENMADLRRRLNRTAYRPAGGDVGVPEVGNGGSTNAAPGL